MKISKFTVNLFQENCYVMWDDMTKQSAIVDPGMMDSRDCGVIDKFLQDNGLKLKYILLTHAHVDHAAGAAYLATKYGVEVYAHLADKELADMLPLQAQLFHLKVNVLPLVINKYVSDGDTLMINDEEIKVLSTPGHSKGGVVYYLPSSGVAFVGDDVFLGSIGRTDLFDGDYDELIESISTKILTLPDETVLYSGHGPATTVVDEKRHNPYIR